MTDLAGHWDRVYARGEDTLSWYQTEALTSLRMLDIAGIDASATVIDIGGGTSRLVDALLDRGHLEPTVLDVSHAAIEQTQHRLGERGREIRWLVEDIRTWRPDRHYDVWHDRAVFHFLTGASDRDTYRDALHQATAPGSIALIATFAPNGPAHCSGLPVARYDAASLVAALGSMWDLVASEREEHRTPGGTNQSFTWVLLRRD